MWNNEESQMAYYGITQFKNLMVDDISVLGFDIESSGIVRDETSKVFVITNTFKKNGKIIERSFETVNDIELVS